MYAQQINGTWTELSGNIVFSPTVYQTAESLTNAQRAAFGVYLIVDVERPALESHQKYGDPVYTINGSNVSRSYPAVDKTSEELAADQQALVADITAQTQQRLDSFAQTRNYDGILSACTYAASTITKFQIEGQYCVNARDETWASLYVLMSEVEAGARPMPESYADVEPHLPPLVWPI